MKEFITIPGKGYWIRPYSLDKFGKWSMVHYPDPSYLEQIRELQAEGMKNVLKKDENGYNIRWSRPSEMMANGKKVGLTPPTVVDANGEPFGDRAIGNGSDVTVKLEVYSHRVPNSTKTAKAARWYSLRVDNLVPFEKSRDFDSNEKQAIQGLDLVPRQPLF